MISYANIIDDFLKTMKTKTIYHHFLQFNSPRVHVSVFFSTEQRTVNDDEHNVEQGGLREKYQLGPAKNSK